MPSSAFSPASAGIDSAVHDLGPLAWVVDELRKSLEASSKALKRFVRDAEAARSSDLAAIDTSQLRIARQQLHQATGALEMVGLAEPALVLHAMETVVQRFLHQPETCTADAAAKIERASFALTEYLDGLLASRTISAVSLFPQYRELREFVRADRIHPADLWGYEWRWIDPVLEVRAFALAYGPDVRKILDQCVLQLIRGSAPQAAREMSELCLDLAAEQTDLHAKIFWKLSAALTEALSLNLLPMDVYIKRAISRILIQYTSLSKGNSAISERLVLDLLFFCVQATQATAGSAPTLNAVRVAYGLTGAVPTDYETVQFGRFNPALLAQARKRITAAKEMWSSFSAGDLSKTKGVTDQFSLISDSLVKLHPPSQFLALTLLSAVETAVLSGNAPRVELAMEVATSILYLEAAFEDLDPNDPQMTLRMTSLAERLENVRAGGSPQSLQNWMEELYRRVSDKQTMGNVVGELRTSLAELEASLDVFFRDPDNKAVLGIVPRQLSQMRGVLSVLGLEQAAQAVLRMRETVESMITAEPALSASSLALTFDHLGNNLGALSFLIDMLNYQPSLAKQLFVYDDEKGELRPLMGRTGKSDPVQPIANPPEVLRTETHAPAQEINLLATDVELPAQSAMVKTLHEATAVGTSQKLAEGTDLLTILSSTVTPSDMPVMTATTENAQQEDDLLDVFLEEAREVVATAQEAVAALEAAPASILQLTVLRRAFHTLKGSGRMVGLNEFGDAAWALEQLLNHWLADQKSASRDFMVLCADALNRFKQWADDIEAKRDGDWSAKPFHLSAEALRHNAPAVLLDTAPGDLPTPAVDQAAIIDVMTLSGADLLTVDVFADFSVGDLEVPIDEVEVPGSASWPIPADATSAIELSALQSPVDTAFSNFLTTASTASFPSPEWVFDLESTESTPASSAYVLSPLNTSDLPIANDLSDITALQNVELSDADFLAHFPAIAAGPMTQQLPEVGENLEMPSVVADVDFEEVNDDALTNASVEDDLTEKDTDTAVLSPLSLDHLKSQELCPESTADDFLPSNPSQIDDEQVKVISSLRIGIPLYNVYLNEADEWSRRLATEVSEWATDPRQPIGESAAALAHSLVGSSATVGFHALSEMARALEAALDHSRAHHVPGVALHGQVFVDVTEDIRRLLHQFAAGFLKAPDSNLLEKLKQLEFPASLSIVGIDMADSSSMPLYSDLSPTDIAALSVQTAPSDDFGSTTFLRAQDSELSPAESNFSEIDDDFDAVDAVDFELFPIFEEEAQELLPQLGRAMRQWFVRPENQSARMEVLRALHTLKGSARLAGAMRLGEMAHRMESEIDYLGSGVSNPQELEPLLGRFDAMQADFDGLRQVGSVQFETLASAAQQTVMTLFESAAPIVAVQSENFSQENEAAAMPVVAAETAEVTAVVHEISLPDETLATVPLAKRPDIPPPQAMALQPLRQSLTASIRVRSQLLDRLIDQAGEVMITRSRLEAELGHLRSALGDMSSNLNRLRQQLRDIEVQAECQMQSRLAQTKELQASFDPLEFDRFTRVQELTRMMAESVDDVATVQRTLQRTVDATEDDLVAQGRQTRELQRDLLRTKMVEFEGISDRLYRVVRQASKDTGKQVRLDLLGGTIKMDRSMLDRMTPVFEHLLRNCVAHGIESPQVRQLAGKDPVGLITVHLQHEGNEVSVNFSDDGNGLDLARIREKALGLGLLQPGQVISDNDASNLVFLPGFTTVQQVTALSGRGIGMEVVRSEVNALGGRIETTTTTGQGTLFKLVLPLTTAVTQVVMVRAGKLSVGVPASVVENVRRIPAAELEQAYRSGTLMVAGEAIPFFWFGALLQVSHQSTELLGKNTQVVIFRSASQRVALHVDEVVGNREVVVKNLGPQLSRLPGLAGMSVLASGEVVLIYNPVAMVVVYGQQARSFSVDAAELLQGRNEMDVEKTAAPLSEAPQTPLILVVDDSITVRRVTQRLLQREGYRVVMAADGLQALERLLDERPAVVLSDIEMPRMDGFDLARNIRADPRLAGLPILMITSRIAEKHREYAMSLGVDHYLGKPYSEDELIGLVRHYCNAESGVAA